MLRRIALAASAVLILTLSPAPAPAAARSWAPVDLGTLSGTRSAAFDINERGQVVGESTTASGEAHAFLWQDGKITDLGTLGGSTSRANAVNDKGQVVGSSTTSSGRTAAVLWRAGTRIDLGRLCVFGRPEECFSSASDINNVGQIVGGWWIDGAAYSDRAFIWQDGAWTNLDTLGGHNARVAAINDLGQMSAWRRDGRDQPTALLLEGGALTVLEEGSYAADINASGDVVGSSGHLWHDGSTVDLWPGEASWIVPHGIDDRGEVVGEGGITSNVRHAVVWHDGVITDLGTLGGSSSVAYAINERGQVVGSSQTASGATHAVLWPDAVAPDVTAPTVLPRVGSVVGGSVPVTVRWKASDLGSGLDRSRLQQQTGSGSWVTVATTTGHSVTRNLTPGTPYRFRVRARDIAGNWSPYHTGPTVRLSRYQESSSLATYDGTWRTVTSAAASGGTASYATTKGASVTIAVSGTGVAWVAPTGPTRGTARVYVDGVHVTNVNLYTRTTVNRVVVFAIRWSVAGTHTVKIVVAGTAGHPRVDLDAFIVTR